MVSEFEPQSQHLKILQCACEAWDRLQAARAQIDNDGLTFTDRLGNMRPHPACAIERDSRIGFIRAIKELGFDAVTGPAGLTPVDDPNQLSWLKDK